MLVPTMTASDPRFHSVHSIVTVTRVGISRERKAWPIPSPIWPTPVTRTRQAATQDPCSHSIGPDIAAAIPPSVTETDPHRRNGRPRAQRASDSATMRTHVSLDTPAPVVLTHTLFPHTRHDAANP